jgi:hypothetical protein
MRGRSTSYESEHHRNMADVPENVPVTRRLITVEYRSRLVPGDFHGQPLWHASTHHVSDSGSTALRGERLRTRPHAMVAEGQGPRWTWCRRAAPSRFSAPLTKDRDGQILVLHETGENVIHTPARAADAPVAPEALPHHEHLRPAPHVGFGRAESGGQAREAVGVWQLTLDCGCDPLDQVDHVDVQLRGACALIGRDHEIIASAR